MFNEKPQITISKALYHETWTVECKDYKGTMRFSFDSFEEAKAFYEKSKGGK